ncbi:MAG: branched-chain amino acid ABC transporter permease [Anaerolineae bacterium]
MSASLESAPSARADRSGRTVPQFLRSPLRVIGSVFILYLVFVAVGNILAGEYTLQQFGRNLIFGLAQGSIYSLIALGYTLVYGVLLMINFAHGDVFMAGAYIGFFAITFMDNAGLLASNTLLAVLFTICVGVAASITVALLLERIAYRPLRGAPRLVTLITAIGASIAIQQLFMLLFGSSVRRYPDVSLYALPNLFPDMNCSVVEGVQVCRGIDLIGGRYDVVLFGLELRILPIHILVFTTSLVLMAALWFFVRRTKTGRAMRSVAEDPKTAMLMGVNVDRVIVITFALGAALAGAAGVLFALYNQQVSPFIGFLPGLKAFTAAVIGGIGSVPGAMFGGLFLGVAETVLPGMLGLSSQLKDVISFTLLVLVLIFRPNGFFGSGMAQRKA